MNPIVGFMLAYMACTLSFAAGLSLPKEPSYQLLGSVLNASNSNVLVVRDDNGGLIESYRQRWEDIAQMGFHVEIDGQCTSACTHILWMIPPERVCITPRAVFGFHQASLWGVPLPALTAELDANYPPVVRDWLKTHEPLTIDVIYMMGRELQGYYRPCAATADMRWESDQ